MTSNGVTFEVPPSWSVVPGASSAGCPSPIPQVRTNVPTTSVASACPAVLFGEHTSLISVGAPSGPYELMGDRTKLGTLPARLFVRQDLESLLVSVEFPTVETQFTFSFMGSHASGNLPLIMEVLHTVRPSPTPAYGLLPAPSDVTTRLVLDHTTVRAGSELNGEIVVTNRSGVSIDLNDADHGCEPGIKAALVDPSWLGPQVFFTADCTSTKRLVPPGTTRWPVTIATTYSPCQVAVLWNPVVGACRAFRSLPPGQYQAVVVGLGLALPAARAMPVTVKRAA